MVASSRLGSASSSHGNIQDNQKANREPSPIQDGSEAVQAVPAIPEEKVKKDGAQLAANTAEAELFKIWASEDQEADTNEAEADMTVAESPEDEIEVADPEAEESPAEEQVNIVEDEEEPEEEQEEPALGFGAEQNDAVLPEH